MKGRGRRLWVALSLALFVAGSVARGAVASPSNFDTLVIPKGVAIQPIGDDFTWLPDPSLKLNASEVKLFFDEGKSASPSDLGLMYASARFWFQFKLKNTTSLNELYLDALLPTIQDLRVYKETDAGEVMEQASIDRRYALAKLSIAPGETATFLASFQTYDTVMFPFTIKTYDGVMNRDFEDTTILAMFLGVVLSLVFYNLFLFISLKHSEFLYYILFTATNAAIALLIANFPPGIQSIAGFSLYPWMPYWRVPAPVTTFLFAKAFLQSAKSYPRMNSVLNAYLAILALAVAFGIITDDAAALSLFEDVYFLVGILILLGAGIHALLKGFAPARYFLLGIGSFLVGIALYLTFPAIGFQANIFTLNVHIIGQALEMILMSLALASFVKQLEQDKVRSEATLQAKSRLLRIISHDIVNPLSIIFGFGQILAKKYPSEDSIERILRSAEAIEKVATYVRKTEASNGIRRAQLESVSLKKCFDELAFLFEHFAQEKGVTLTFEMSGRDIFVAAQEVCLRNEIIGNLVSNAIKFSFVGSEVTVKAETVEDKVRITIKDRGIGMPKNVIATLFDPARNLSRQGTSGEIGNGYGMPIVHSFVTDYGGSIEIRSVSFDEDRVNCGTEVIITLLRADGPAPAVPVDRRPLFPK